MNVLSTFCNGNGPFKIAPEHGNNAVDGLNETYKRYLKEKMERIVHLKKNST